MPHFVRLSAVVCTIAALTGCASAQVSQPVSAFVAAALQMEPSVTPAASVDAPVASSPAQPGFELPRLSQAPSTQAEPETAPPESRDPAERIARANAAARIEPTQDGYANAVQVYAFDAGALFQIYAAPGQITDIALQPGEALSVSGPVAAGDTTRWIIGDTRSGAGADARIHILVKPTRPALRTNLIINTDRRTYHIELRSTASTYMASVSWRYPQDDLIALQTASEQAAVRTARPMLDIDALDFDYTISGADTPWRPRRAFDDGRQVIIEFGQGLVASSLPPLFVRSDDGRSAELVNYRVVGRRMIVDRLFAAAELRLGGARGRESIVRITKTARETR